VEEGLARTIEWTKANMHVIKRCMTKHRKFVPDVGKFLDA
jgi:hypothetical protein